MGEEKKMIIELGGGNNPQFHPNLDVKPGPGVDIVANLEEPLPILDAEYDMAVCNYTLEHLSWRKVKSFLKEVVRILKIEGKFVVVTANLKEQAKMIVNRKWGDPSDEFFESRLIFGDQDYSDNTHKCGFSPELAVKWFRRAGFGDILVEHHPNCPTDMVITATKPMLDRFFWLRNQLDKLAKSNTQVVDIGCSDCAVTYDRADCTWVDVVLHKDVVRAMRYLGLTPIPEDKYVRARAEDLPFEDKQFGVALITELLEHVPNPVEVLNEVKRVARHALITVPNEYEWSDEHNPFQNSGHLRHYTEQMLRNDLDMAGIKKYTLNKLEYQGWSFFTVIADLGVVSTIKKQKSPRLDSSFYDESYYKPGPKSDFSLPYTWEHESGRHMHLAEYIKKTFNPKTILDIGCAKGFAVKAFLHYDIDAQGFDISEWAISNCEPEAKGRLKVADMRNGIPYPDNSFDMIYMESTLEHIEREDLDAVAKEMLRVAKEFILIGVLYDKSGMIDPSHRTFMSKSEWIKLFTVAGCHYDTTERGFIDTAMLFRTRPISSRTKVALLSTPFLTVPPKNYGGLERIVADTAYCLAKEGHDVTIFCPNGSHVEGCKMVNFGEPIDSVYCNWLEEEQRATNVAADAILNDGFQIVHGMNWFGFEYALKARNLGLKCLHTHHGGINMEWWGRSKPPFPINLVAISNWMKSVYANYGFNSKVVYNGIPIEEYPYQKKKGDRLLFVGRLDSFKRPHIAIELARKTGLGLDIVGGSFVYDTAYLNSVKSECDGKQIKLYLDVGQKAKVELYQNAKAVIFPSEMGEPFGLITPEANCCGTPVIASRDGAIPEVLQEGVTGFICDNVDQMVEAVKKIDTIKPKDCRKNGEKFSRENMAKGYAEAYQEVLRGQEW